MNQIHAYFRSCARVLLVLAMPLACSKEGFFDNSRAKGSEISFSSYRKQVLTKSDPSLLTFSKGTKYALFGLPSQSSEGDYKWNTGNVFDSFPQEGTESANNTVDYTPTASFHSEPLDFYALTYGNTTVPSVSGATDGITPTITISETDDRIPDLMHSNTVKGKTPSDGNLLLPFEHASAAINFVIAKQDESSDDPAHKRLMDVKVTKIELKGVAESASMNLVTGKWTWETSGTRVSYNNVGGFAISSAEQSVGAEDLLVFPNDDNQQISVSVSLEGLKEYDAANSTVENPVYKLLNGQLSDNTTVTEGACTVTLPLKELVDNTETPLRFERNHKYTLALMVLRGDVRIITVSPQIYEWVDVNLDPAKDAVLGQPVTIGGLMWMDRNVGATSADCEKDWDNTLGYYYQFGRNIPFILDIEALRSLDSQKRLPFEYDNDGTTNKYLTMDAPNREGAWPNGYIYTWDNNGKKVSTAKYTYATALEDAGQKVAYNPGDEGDYSFMAYAGETYKTSPKFWHDNKNPDPFIQTVWASTSKQPAPKGWRIPNIKDALSILPEENFDWATQDLSSIGVDEEKSTSGIIKTEGGSYKYQYVYGFFKANPDASGEWSAPVETDHQCFHGIKHLGEAKAYRILIEQLHGANEGSGKSAGYFVRFSIFPSSADERLKVSGSEWNLHQFDWEHPAAYIDFPLQGNIAHQYNGHSGFSFWGFGKAMWLMLTNYKEGDTKRFYSCKLTQGKGCGVTTCNQGTTIPIRLVRDISAE